MGPGPIFVSHRCLNVFYWKRHTQLTGRSHIYINISIYDFIGRHIITLFNGNQSVGTHIVKWDGRNNNGKQVSAGMYIYSLKSNSHVQSNKMILLR